MSELWIITDERGREIARVRADTAEDAVEMARKTASDARLYAWAVSDAARVDIRAA